MSMATMPVFPDFRPITLDDRDAIVPMIRRYQSEVSEWTFTNLFMWRDHYRFQWSIYEDWLIVMGDQDGDGAFAMQPLGPPSRRDVVNLLLTWLKEERGAPEPSIERADNLLVKELEGAPGLRIDPLRDHFDYVYSREDLCQLAGNRYRTKRNHINKVNRTYAFEFGPLEERHLDACLELQSNWCQIRRCDEDLSLLGEWDAIQEVLKNFTVLDLNGGVITINGKVEAFTVGEMLNDTTAVIHIEKANPEIGELYTVINRECAEKCWGGVPYINREQDLGIPGLREAKSSYHPHHMVEKYRITLLNR